MVPAIFARWAPDLVDEVDIREGERVFDLACGTGAVTRCLVDRIGQAGRVVGLDVNPGMLAVARKAVASSCIEWLEGCAVNMQLPDSAFDVVLCQQGLQFFPDKLAALHEMRRVLVPGGRLAMSVWRSVEHSPGFRVLEEKLADRVGASKAALPPFSMGDAQAIRELVVSAGFSEVQIRADVKLSRFQSAEHMVRIVVAGAPTMLGALAEQGPGVVDDLAAEFVEATRSYVDDQGWATPSATNIITAIA